jgi:hypothetical protein
VSCDHPVTQAITVDDFKDQFYRDFNFVITWVAGTYNTGDQVFYEVNSRFYECLSDGVTSIPTTVVDWKQIDPTGLVSDKDITNAYAEACTNYNSSLFGDDDEIKLSYLYLSAHYLVHDLNAGGVDSSGVGQVNSRSVGNVSESYSIPQWQLDSPIYSFYTKSTYGLKYLNLVIPKLTGNTFTVEGCTTP